MEIRKGMRHDWKDGPQSCIGKRAMGGYFLSIPLCSKWDAMKPYSEAIDTHSYPAVFVEVGTDIYIMWCLASVIRRSEGWCVHASRVCVWWDNEYFETLLLQHDPTPPRMQHRPALPALVVDASALR
jgi:hypothetical protein